jgi:hypothetical protein
MAYNNKSLPLSERVKILKKDAREREIGLKAVAVASRLGITQPKNHGAWHNLQDDEMSISYDDYGDNMSINYKGTNVFSLHLGNIEAYRPDIENWIFKLDELYQRKARPIMEAEIKAKQTERETEIKSKWGLDT